MTAPAYEYRRATWAEVCDLGPKGWRMVAIPPIVEMKNLLGQMQAGEPLYAMERAAPELQTGDCYGDALRRPCIAGMSSLGALGPAADQTPEDSSRGPA